MAAVGDGGGWEARGTGGGGGDKGTSCLNSGHTHTHTHARTHARAHTHARTHTRTHTHTHTHARTHARTHTHTHTQTHARTHLYNTHPRARARHTHTREESVSQPSQNEISVSSDTSNLVKAGDEIRVEELIVSLSIDVVSPCTGTAATGHYSTVHSPPVLCFLFYRSLLP